MNDIESNERNEWLEPVRVRVGYGFPEIIRGPREALDYLNWRWPVREGIYYVEALRQCTASLSRQIPVEKVRETFVLASIEAEMLG